LIYFYDLKSGIYLPWRFYCDLLETSVFIDFHIFVAGPRHESDGSDRDFELSPGCINDLSLRGAKSEADDVSTLCKGKENGLCIKVFSYLHCKLIIWPMELAK